MGLIVNELTKKFGEKTAVDHLSFSMESPGVFGLLGTNGAGKTTTIRTIPGITPELPEKPYPLDIYRRNVGFI